MLEVWGEENEINRTSISPKSSKLKCMCVQYVYMCVYIFEDTNIFVVWGKEARKEGDTEEEAD